MTKKLPWSRWSSMSFLLLSSRRRQFQWGKRSLHSWRTFCDLNDRQVLGDLEYEGSDFADRRERLVKRREQARLQPRKSAQTEAMRRYVRGSRGEWREWGYWRGTSIHSSTNNIQSSKPPLSLKSAILCLLLQLQNLPRRVTLTS